MLPFILFIHSFIHPLVLMREWLVTWMTCLVICHIMCLSLPFCPLVAQFSNTARVLIPEESLPCVVGKD